MPLHHATVAAVTTGTRSDVTLKLSQLQNLCKRDPVGYKEDYLAQVRRLESELGILKLSTSSDTAPAPQLLELIQFAAAVSSSSYKGVESDKIANLLISMLLGSNENMIVSTVDDKSTTPRHHKAASTLQAISSNGSNTAVANTLHREVRKTCVSALILMRNKGTIPPLVLLELFFCLIAVVPDKQLREQLYKHLVNDIRNINQKKRQDHVNRAIQTFLHQVVLAGGTNKESNDDDTATNVAARRATDLVCELYRRRVWTDDRVVAIVASAVQSNNTGTMCRALRFFLNIEEKMASDDMKKQEQDEHKLTNMVDFHSHSKKTAHRQRSTEKQLKARKKAILKKEALQNGDWIEAKVENDKGVEASKKLYPAIELLHDPQGLAEYALKRLKSVGQFKYEVRLLLMNFCTRLVGNHELLLLSLYPFLQKYLGGAQRDVTAVLAYTVQACHSYVPPDEVYGLLKVIAHNFITERCSEEQMAVGINAVRAICARVPSVMSVEECKDNDTSATYMDIEAFARDIAGYGNHRDRSVSMAGKAWTNFVRLVNPGLLQGKQRGMQGSARHKSGVKPQRYGQTQAAAGVEGSDLLVEYEAKKAAADAKRAREEDEESVDEEDEWQEVEDDGDDADENSDGFIEVDEDDDDEDADNDEEADEDGDGNQEPQVDEESEEDSDAEAPELVKVTDEITDEAISQINVSNMTQKDRDALKQQVSSTRIFSTSDFIKMRKLVERERLLKSDPREAARRKRAIARGQEFEALSDDDDDDSDSEDDTMRVSGVVDPNALMAESRKKKQSKAERLEGIIAGRSAFESKKREGGSTNIEKIRKKSFIMTKNSRVARGKSMGKVTLKGKPKEIGKHQKKKRRRKF